MTEIQEAIQDEQSYKSSSPKLKEVGFFKIPKL